MTTYDSSENVRLEVHDISTFTIGTFPATISDDQFVRFLAKADDVATQDNPGFTQPLANEAVALLICHYIARKQGLSGKTSVSIGQYSHTKSLKSGLTSWIDDYRALIAEFVAGKSEASLGDSGGIVRDDANMQGLALDQSVVYSVESDTGGRT